MKHLTANPSMADIKQRLYTIRNIANIATYYPEQYAEAYVLQDVIEHIGEMVQELIEGINV